MSTQLDILNESTPVDVSTVRSALPILSPSVQTCILAESKLETNKKATGSNMNLKLTCINSSVSTEGKPINPGFPIFDTVSLVRTYKDDGTTVSYEPMGRLVEIVESIDGKLEGAFTPRQLVDRIQAAIGRQLTVRTKVEDDPTYGQKTRVARYIKLA